MPVPYVTYLDDNEKTVTLKCYFDFPAANNVSFKIQWFVNGGGAKASTICENPNEGSCDRRHVRLTTSDYQLGDQVNDCKFSLTFFGSLN